MQYIQIIVDQKVIESVKKKKEIVIEQAMELSMKNFKRRYESLQCRNKTNMKEIFKEFKFESSIN
jgi:hypothetical protein